MRFKIKVKEQEKHETLRRKRAEKSEYERAPGKKRTNTK